MFQHSVWSVITVHNLTPVKRDVNTVVSDQRSRFTAPYNASDHRSAKALAVIQNAGFDFNYSVTHRIRHSCSYCTVNGCLEDQEQYNGIIRALEKCWTKRISVAGVYVEK